MLAFSLPSISAVLLAMAMTVQPADGLNEALWDAARAGDHARVIELLDRGVDVDAATRYGGTALWFASDKGHLEIVRLLLDRGADLSVQDTFYESRPVDMALGNGHFEVARVLLETGSTGAAAALAYGIEANEVALVSASLAGRDLTPASLNHALALARRTGHEEIITLINARAATLLAAPAPEVSVDRALLETYVGTYRNAATNRAVTVDLKGNRLVAEGADAETLTLIATGRHAFRTSETGGPEITFYGRAGLIQQMTIVQANGDMYALARGTDPAHGVPPAAGRAPASGSDRATREDSTLPMSPRPWPAFRGAGASGNGDGQGAVVEWDVATKQNIKWTTPIPGLSHSSPIIWGDRVFVTTAISLAGDQTFLTRASGRGLTDRVRPVTDRSEHVWKVYCLDKANGMVLWERTAFQGTLSVRRHPKGTQANSTAVTDGRYVFAFFGSVGLLVAYDFNGTLVWERDLGVMDNGWFLDPTYQWGHASSPIIYDTLVIVQGDQQQGSFVAAYDVDTGQEIWRTERDEISTWGTPTIVSGTRDELVTNGPTVRAYDPSTGELLWSLGPNSEITVGTPVAGNGLVYVTGGYPPVRPIYAIKPGGSGDLSLPKGRTSSQTIAWSTDQGGTYMPTPLLYGEYLYTCNNNGILTVYHAATGERVYRARVGGGGGAFSASPIAGDGLLYHASEDGDVYVIKAGPAYEELARNEMGEVMMATPAMSGGLIVVRTLSHVFGIGR